MFPILDLSWEENVVRRKWNNSPLFYCASGQFPDDPGRIKDTQIHYVTSQTYYH
jgi:hypothetical protein